MSRRSRLIRIALIASGIVMLVAAVLGSNTVATLMGWVARPVAPEDLAGRLSPEFRLVWPEGGPGPDGAPTALLFSGCDGPGDNLDTWARYLSEAGWASVIVDSHTPRNLDEVQSWRLVCAGQILPGGERAGDVSVALAYVRDLPFVDPERLFLIGASHGGWAILDFLALESAETPPYNLTEWPAGGRLDGVRGIILVYPYCGPGSIAARQGWTADVPVLFLLAEDDRIAPEADCLDLADRLHADGLPVEARVLAGTTHGFDQRTKAPGSLLEYDAEATRRALALGRAFLMRSAARADGV